MKISIIFGLSAFLYCTKIIMTDAAYTDDIDEITLLVLDVQKYFDAVSIFIIHPGNNESLELTSQILRMLLEFSNKFVLSMALNYEDIIRHYNTYYLLISKPMFVLLLTSRQEIQWFQQATSHFVMSSAMWIVIFTDSSLEMCKEPPGNYFNLTFDTQMLVKCKGDPTIREWYSLHGRETRIYELADWDPIHRFQLRTDENIYERRRDLEGKKLTLVTTKATTELIELQSNQLTDYFALIMQELSQSINFTLNILYEEEYFGSYNENTGKWSGAIGRLARGDAELSAGEFSMTGQRLEVIDFSFPVRMVRTHLFVKHSNDSLLNWSAFFQVYASDVWIGLEVMCIISLLLISFIKVKLQKLLSLNQFFENYFNIWGIYCQQGLPVFPTALSMRIAYFSILIKAVILYAIYSACLISFLTVSNPSLPFKNLDDFAREKTHKIVMMRESAHYDQIKYSTDKVIQEIQKLMPEPKKLPSSMSDGFRMVCRKKVAFYTTGTINNLVRIPCNIISINTGRMEAHSIALRKGSHYKGLINYHLLKLQGTGILCQLGRRVYRKVGMFDNTYNPMDLNSVITLFFLLLLGILLSGFILSCEIAAYWITNWVKQERKITSNYCIRRY